MANEGETTATMDKLSTQDATAEYLRLTNMFTSLINEQSFHDGFEACFADDCEWLIGPPLKFEAVGPQAIRRLITEKLDGLDFLFQIVGSSVVTEVHADRLVGITSIIEIGRVNAEQGFQVLGVYRDEVVKRDGAWKFGRRKFRVVAIDPSPLAYKLYQHVPVD
ncbi:nuclear transport factor 2 family protein [Spirillospora sp. CA-255316]